MKRRAVSGVDLVAMEDRRLQRQLCHERDMNQVFERRCPSVPVTAVYQRGPCSPATFHTEAAWLQYLIKREHAKFNPAVRLDDCGARKSCHRPPLGRR